MKIFKSNFEKLAVSKAIHKRHTRIRVIGEWRSLFPKSVKDAIEKAVDATQNYDSFHLSLLMGYNGTDDMVGAVNSIVEDVLVNGKSILVENLIIKKHLLTAELPAVDLLVRTGGEPHLSNGFMMWDTANAQLYFTDTYWPNFSILEFDRSISDYSRRRKKLGA